LHNYTLIRSARRKTLLIQVKQGQVIVRAPVYVSALKIAQFVGQKSAWLQKKIVEYQQQVHALPTFQHHSTLYYLGEKKHLKISYAINASTYINNDKIVIELPFRQRKKKRSAEQFQALIKQQLGQFFKEKLHHYLSEKLPLLSQRLTAYPQSYKIRFYRSRWGSCNSRGELSFNYLLMMVPNWVIDYVIIHELCHLTYLNHSNNFWQLVKLHCNQVEPAKQWLKQHQQELIW